MSARTDQGNCGHFIGLDWGSTNARALLFAPDGQIVAERDEPLGIKHVPPGGHRAAFDRLTAEWRERHGAIPALLSGMIGSRTGWREAPYVACPAKLTELHGSFVRAPEAENVFIVPGLSLSGERADVMRGEELQLLGLGERGANFDWVCIPGTHSKWIRAEWPVVREFHTAMTGEIFAAVAQHTLFSTLIPPAAGRGFSERAFDAGLERSAAPHGILNTLFGIRADLLLGRVAASEIADVISGLLIGTEVRHMLPSAPTKSQVALLAAPNLQPRYLQALAFFGFAATPFDVKQVTADGFVALRGSL
ncbi:MAG: 2-dehydro-3-deoxygalactonokinase [Opitutaceae bacterium]